MSKPIIGIIGFGIVGRAVQHGFAQMADFRIYDVNDDICEDTLEDTIIDSDYIFVCVPTPMDKNGVFDSSIIDSVLDYIINYTNYTDKIIIIKSTVVPGTTLRYCQKYPDSRIVMSPEFLTERTSKLDFINTSRIIFGINMDVNAETTLDKLVSLYKPRFPSTKMFVTDPTTAELAKYTSNCFLATKIAFFNEIYQISKKLGVKYDRLIKLVIADGRIGNSHYTVPGHDGDFGFGGTCFPKDLNALIHLSKELDIEPLVMEGAWNKNIEVRKKKDWINEED